MPDRRGPQRGFFDLWSRIYDIPLVQRVTYLPVQDAVVASLPDTPDLAVLDVGCGTGLLTTRMAEVRPRARVTGCDFSLGMLEQASSRGARARWVQGDALRLPFRDQAFDVVTSTEAFHWFPDQAAALREFCRVLVPGGRLLVAFVNPPFAAVSGVTRRMSRAVGQPLFWPTRERMRAEVQGAGLRLVGQRRIPRLPAGVLLPPVLTVAERPRPAAPA